MKIGMLLKNPSLKFFLLVFALSLPIWLLGTLAKHLSIEFPINLPVSALQAVCPLIAAFILVSQEEQSGGIGRLLKRFFDQKRIRQKIWYIPIICLLPLIYLLSYEAMCLRGFPCLKPHISFLTIPLLFVVFFLSAGCEETGWTGYVVDPMQDRWGALKASILLGIIWALWHVVPDIQAHRTWVWITEQRFYTVVLRILIVWLYNNTEKSMFATILFHDMDNVSFYSLFPNNNLYYDPAITPVIAFIVTVIITLFYGPTTLAHPRIGRKCGQGRCTRGS